MACLSALVGQALPGDVVGLMCHAERQEVYDWIAEHGGTPDTPETLAGRCGPRSRCRRHGLRAALDLRRASTLTVDVTITADTCLHRHSSASAPGADLA